MVLGSADLALDWILDLVYRIGIKEWFVIKNVKKFFSPK